MTEQIRPEVAALRARLERSLDAARSKAMAQRREYGYRTARENLANLVDADSFLELGQLAVAAQRSRRDYEDLQTNTAADGIITGTCTINAELLSPGRAAAAVVINDYTVLAGTQGFFHHMKLDRICELAQQRHLPLIMFTEGGGGRPGDTDVATQIAGLNVDSFRRWAGLTGKVPRIAVNNGYCFAGNAALFGSADFTIATRTSWIGMAGPAMIEGGGLGSFDAKQIGPIEVQERNGVVDLVADDEPHAAQLARKLLSYFQGSCNQWRCPEQTELREAVPEDRRWGYSVRNIIQCLADEHSFVELRRVFGRSVVTGLIRIEGRPLALIANDCQQLGGAIDAEAADKTGRFIEICNAFGLPILSLTDTPGFMVGPDSEQQSAVRRMSALFVAGAKLTVPVVAIVLRKGYGLGAMAMTGGSFLRPVFTAAWPTGEFGGMGLEGAVRLGYRKELDAIDNPAEKEALFEQLVAQMYDRGKASEAAAHLEIDAVIDPADTRAVILKALRSPHSGGDKR